jgi:cytochrome c-type biogenesis protein CcmH/NrfG
MQGMEGKFRVRLSRAEALDQAFENGAVHTAWGRFYYELPWPKYDAERSEERLRAALKMNPANVRARVYLAELFRKEGKPEKARALLEEAVAREPGAYDRPEERRWQERARELLAAKP